MTTRTTRLHAVGLRTLAGAVALTALLSTGLAGCGEESAHDLQLAGMQRAARGDAAGALAELDRAVAKSPHDATLLVVRAGVHETLGDLPAAIADYERAVTIAPGLEPGIRAPLAHLRRRAGVDETGSRSTGLPAPRAAAAEVSGPTAPGPRVTNLNFCSSEPRGHLDFDPQPGDTYHPGDVVWIYVDVQDLASRPRADDTFENAYRQTLTLREPSGRVILHDVVIDAVRPVAAGTPADRIYLHNRIPVPLNAPAGAYRVDVRLEDRIADRADRAGGWFTVAR